MKTIDGSQVLVQQWRDILTTVDCGLTLVMSGSAAHGCSGRLAGVDVKRLGASA